MHHTSYIELSRSALKNNIQFVKEHLHSNCRFSSVIKGNAYGHGIELFVPLAERCGVRHFSVFSADEALRALRASQKKPDILIMGMVEGDSLEWAIKNGIEFFVSDPNRFHKAIQIAKKLKTKAKIHVEVETGMHRTGFSRKEFEMLFPFLKREKKFFHFRGLCTHFAGAESIANYYRIKKQRTHFAQAQKKLQGEGLKPKYFHVACSAAALRYPATQMDLARIGILQYGFFPSNEIRIEMMRKKKRYISPLTKILSWKSEIMAVKEVRKGNFVGYGNFFLANEDMRVAAIPVGYGQGFSRSMSNRGNVLIHGRHASVIGTVNMNMMMVDVTHLENVEKGDEVVLIGQQGNNEISVASFGEMSEQMNYELLTRLPSEIPRKITE
ncbi:MAG: alanine racemase [Candidatus Gracilibacteria bacterium]|nr:alanine racemase [Candidatus Gracilibacteria bacterium]